MFLSAMRQAASGGHGVLVPSNGDDAPQNLTTLLVNLRERLNEAHASEGVAAGADDAAPDDIAAPLRKTVGCLLQEIEASVERAATRAGDSSVVRKVVAPGTLDLLASALRLLGTMAARFPPSFFGGVLIRLLATAAHVCTHIRSTVLLDAADELVAGVLTALGEEDKIRGDTACGSAASSGNLLLEDVFNDALDAAATKPLEMRLPKCADGDRASEGRMLSIFSRCMSRVGMRALNVPEAEGIEFAGVVLSHCLRAPTTTTSSTAMLIRRVRPETVVETIFRCYERACIELRVSIFAPAVIALIAPIPIANSPTTALVYTRLSALVAATVSDVVFDFDEMSRNDAYQAYMSSLISMLDALECMGRWMRQRAGQGGGVGGSHENTFATHALIAHLPALLEVDCDSSAHSSHIAVSTDALKAAVLRYIRHNVTPAQKPTVAVAVLTSDLTVASDTCYEALVNLLVHVIGAEHSGQKSVVTASAAVNLAFPGANHGSIRKRKQQQQRGSRAGAAATKRRRRSRDSRGDDDASMNPNHDDDQQQDSLSDMEALPLFSKSSFRSMGEILKDALRKFVHSTRSADRDATSSSRQINGVRLLVHACKAYYKGSSQTSSDQAQNDSTSLRPVIDDLVSAQLSRAVTLLKRDVDTATNGNSQQQGKENQIPPHTNMGYLSSLCLNTLRLVIDVRDDKHIFTFDSIFTILEWPWSPHCRELVSSREDAILGEDGTNTKDVVLQCRATVVLFIALRQCAAQMKAASSIERASLKQFEEWRAECVRHEDNNKSNTDGTSAAHETLDMALVLSATIASLYNAEDSSIDVIEAALDAGKDCGQHERKAALLCRILDHYVTCSISPGNVVASRGGDKLDGARRHWTWMPHRFVSFIQEELLTLYGRDSNRRTKSHRVPAESRRDSGGEGGATGGEGDDNEWVDCGDCSCVLNIASPILQEMLSSNLTTVRGFALQTLSTIIERVPGVITDEGSRETLVSALHELVADDECLRARATTVAMQILRHGNVLCQLFPVTENTHSLVATGGDCTMEAAVTGMVQFIVNTLNKDENGNSRDVPALFSLLGHVGSFTNSKQALSLCVMFLISRVDSQEWEMRHAAVLSLHDIARSKNLSLDDLIMNCNQALIYVTRSLLEKAALTECVSAMLGLSEQDFLRQILPTALPNLTRGKKTDLLRELARRLGMEVADLMTKEVYHAIAANMVEDVDVSDGKFSEFLAYVESLTGCDVGDLLFRQKRKLLSELLWRVGAEREHAHAVQSTLVVPDKRKGRVKNFLSKLAKILVGKDSLISDLLNDRGMFSMLLSKLAESLESSEASMASKHQQAMRCLGVLIELIDVQVTTYIPKLMALLARGLELQHASRHSIHAYRILIRAISEHATDHLQRLAQQIFVSLLPCFDDGKASEVSEDAADVLLDFLGLLKTNVRDDSFRRVLQDFPALPAMSSPHERGNEGNGDKDSKLQELSRMLESYRMSMTLDSRLEALTNGVRHENTSVRYTNMCELLPLLRENQQHVYRLAKANSESSVSRLLGALLRSCTEETRTPIGTRLLLKCAECLGELGALDPARVKITLGGFCPIELKDMSLAKELICSHLARVLRYASDLDMLGSAELAVQELLKMSKASTLHDDLWIMLPTEIQDLVQPCLRSQYKLEESGVPAPASVPVFGDKTLSFRRWAVAWIRHLLAYARGRRSKIFKACGGVLKYDTRMMIYLVPRIVQNVICAGNKKAASDVKEEILQVLHEAGMEDGMRSSSAGNADGIGKVGDTAQEQSFGVESTESGRSLTGRVHKSAQLVFTLVDHLKEWHERMKKESGGGGGLVTEDVSSSVDIPRSAVKAVESLISEIPLDTLALAALRTGAFARALMYFESHIRNDFEMSKGISVAGLNPASAFGNNKLDDETVNFLRDIYRGLEEPDMISAVSELRLNEDEGDCILVNEIEGRWTEALPAYEQRLICELRDEKKTESTSESQDVRRQLQSSRAHAGILRCLLRMGHVQSALNFAEGLRARNSHTFDAVSQYAIEASWRLGRWDFLDANVQHAERRCALDGNTPSPERLLSQSRQQLATWEVHVGHIISSLHERNVTKLEEHVIRARQELLDPLSAASMESYSRAYPTLVRLHILRDLETASLIASEDPSKPSQALLKTTEDWGRRLHLTQSALAVREPILALHRAVHTIAGMDAHAARTWHETAKLCRKAHHSDAAWMAVLEASRHDVDALAIERAKQLWLTGKEVRAIDCLLQLQERLQSEDLRKDLRTSGNVSTAYREKLVASSTHSPRMHAKTALLLARYVHLNGQRKQDDVVKLYQNAVDYDTKWEKAYLYLAKYYEELLADARQREQRAQLNNTKAPSLRGAGTYEDFYKKAVTIYFKSARFGHKYLFRSMPRALTLWFDADKDDVDPNRGKRLADSLTKEVVVKMLDEVPKTVWLGALPQIVSRVLHRHVDTMRTVVKILRALLVSHPHQTLWAMVVVLKSTYSKRKQQAHFILNHAKKTCPENRKLFEVFLELMEQLERLCHIDPDGGQRGRSKSSQMNVTRDFPRLKKMMPVMVMVPCQSQLWQQLYDDDTESGGCTSSAGRMVTIANIFDDVTVFSSLQRPKKIKFLGSDGNEYSFLAKPKDDLRKDSRMMEFTGMVNGLLRREPATRRRQLYIRTFVVVPINEDSGIVEWVPHSQTMRHSTEEILRAARLLSTDFETYRRIKTSHKKLQDQSAPSYKYVEWLQSTMKMLPAKFHRWFFNKFTEPATWFRARLNYTRTIAVWSMIGHIVGLGDRHGENILLDESNGDVAHIDFGMLFDKGLTLEVPEMVPFRMTQNVIDGFGVTGCEGVFMNASEATLRVLRENSEALMGVLETFLHDPLVEWTKRNTQGDVTDSENPRAKEVLNKISSRLRGVVVGVNAKESIPLSVEGQARKLVEEATKIESLAKMYIWWMPWL